MSSQPREVLARLLREAGLPAAVSIERLSGRGLDHEIYLAGLSDDSRVVLRCHRPGEALEATRAAFLESHGVPCPRLLAEDSEAGLYEFAPGTLLGDLIETGQCTADHWRAVGAAFQRVHAVRFPSGLAGEVGPGSIVLRPADPVAELHQHLEQCNEGLQLRSPSAISHLPELHRLIDLAAAPLRTATTSLLHGDINMWNIIVSDERALLIDWDQPRVGGPAKDVALLDKHASLFNGQGLDPAFFEAYGHRAEPNTAVYRVVETLFWAASADWEAFATDAFPVEFRIRTQSWLQTLLAYIVDLPAHLDRLRTTIATSDA
jgi:aminoglycoside phosphotransferase (APT) family kinase protein